jgi:hypothetical protein
MQDIFHDPEFERFLYGGVRDLEEPVGELVYNLWKKGIEPTWSCGGHIGKWIPQAEKQAITGYYAYEQGRLCYSITEEAIPLTKKLLEIIRVYPFASLNPSSLERGFVLEMNDIATLCSIKGYAKMQVLPELATRRYEEFLSIWKELTEWSRGL